MAAGEEALVARLGQLLGAEAGELVGDDAARLELDGSWAATVDSQIEGVHVPVGIDPAVLGRRLVAVNASDLAAVGADPAYGLLALTTTSGWDHERCLAGVGEAAAEIGLVVAGGDITRGSTPSASLTLLGRLPTGRNWLRRANARPGDTLWLTGGLGLSALGRYLLQRGASWSDGEADLAGLPKASRTFDASARDAIARHLAPRPRLDAGRWLSRRPRAAAIDISDGIAKDLHRLLAASGAGASIQLDPIVGLDAGALDLARSLDLDPERLVVSGGEDYELLVALPPGERPPVPWRRLGNVEAALGVRWSDGTGSTLDPVGWDHLGGS